MKMDEVTAVKSEIDMKLNREMNSMALLRESLNKSNQMTQNMMTILTSFENRLGKLEGTITPVYQETKSLQIRHENIEKTISSLDHVIGYYHVADEVEPFIREGPSGGLEKYLECMESLQKAVHYFNSNNPGSPELSQALSLFEQGKDALEREFRNLLSRHSRPVPPIIVQDVCGTDEELPNEDQPIIEHLPARVLQELAQISQWLMSYGSPDIMQVYSTIRASILIKTLQGLKEHLKTQSGGSGNYSMPHSPAMQGFSPRSPAQGDSPKTGKLKGGKDTPARKMAQKMAFVRKATQSLKRSFVGMDPNRRQAPGMVDVPDEGSPVLMDTHVEFYIIAATALLRLIQSEFLLMHGIIPEKNQREVFDKLIQSSLELVIREGEQIAHTAKKYISKHDYSAVYSIFPVTRHLRNIKPEFDKTLEGCLVPTRSALATLITTLDTTGAKALEEFIESIRNDPDKASNMPKDGTVHELTNNCMIFLEHLLDYAETAGAMLMTQDPSGLPTVTDPVEKNKVKLAEYLTKVLSALGLNLSNKSETYSDPTLKSIFMMNNYNYILKSLKRSGLIALVHMWNPDVERYFEDQIIEQKRLYSQSWSRVLHYVMEVHKPISQQRTHSPDLGKLKDKDRQNIKDKFTGFNKEIEEISRIQKAYAIPDADLRESLKKENREFILSKYQMFRDKYTQTTFSKNPEKYIKYTVKDVEDLINNFFDAAA